MFDPNSSWSWNRKPSFREWKRQKPTQNSTTPQLYSALLYPSQSLFCSTSISLALHFTLHFIFSLDYTCHTIIYSPLLYPVLPTSQPLLCSTMLCFTDPTLYSKVHSTDLLDFSVLLHCAVWKPHWFGCLLKHNSWIPWNLSFRHILFHEKRRQTMLWCHNARVNSHQRWKQTRFRVCFHL